MKEYYKIAKDLDVDEFESAIGFEPIGQNDQGEDHGKCPDPWGLHKNGDRTGKFSINREKKVYNCFVCGGGTLLSLTMAIRECDESEAIDWLRQFSSKTYQSDESFIDEIDRIFDIKTKSVIEETLPWFNPNVLNQWDDNDHPWYQKRGINEETRKLYNLCINKETNRTKGVDSFQGETIVLPHFWEGKLVGWQNRWMNERPKWVPKYTNTNDFPKKTTVFGWDQIQFATGPIVIVESVPSVLFLASLNIPAVATFGANVSKEQMKILRSCQQGIVLAQDNDQAGDKWRETLLSYLDRYIPIMEMEIAWEDDIGETRMVENPDVTKGLYHYPLYS